MPSVEYAGTLQDTLVTSVHVAPLVEYSNTALAEGSGTTGGSVSGSRVHVGLFAVVVIEFLRAKENPVIV